MSENVGTIVEKRSFPTLHVASAATGVALCSGVTVSLLHEISEFAVGHPVWTHELGDKATTDRIHAAILAQLPDLPTREQAQADWQQAAEIATEAYGDTVELQRGAMERSEGPISSLSRMMGKAS